MIAQTLLSGLTVGAIYALVAATGLESRIASIVKDKKALFGGLFDGKSIHDGFESVVRLVAMLMSRPSRPLRWRLR